MLPNRKWNREGMILALNLYLKLPFSKMNSTHPAIIDLAELIGRSSNAVALRLVNYASCDPILHSQGIKGMVYGKQQCLSYWNEFINNRSKLLAGIRTIHYLCREMGKEISCTKKVQDRTQQCLLHVYGLPGSSAEVHIYDQLD